MGDAFNSLDDLGIKLVIPLNGVDSWTARARSLAAMSQLLALYPLLDLIEQALMNLDCVIRHAEKAMLAIDSLCIDKRDERVV